MRSCDQSVKLPVFTHRVGVNLFAQSPEVLATNGSGSGSGSNKVGITSSSVAQSDMRSSFSES